MQGPIESCDKIIAIDRLENIIIGAAAQGADRELVIAMARNQENWNLRMLLLKLSQQSQSIHPRHLDVAYDRPIGMLPQQIKGLARRAHRLHFYHAHA